LAVASGVEDVGTGGAGAADEVPIGIAVKEGLEEGLSLMFH